MFRSADRGNATIHEEPESPMENELDPHQGYPLSYITEHEYNEYWCIAEDNSGQVECSGESDDHHGRDSSGIET